MTARISLALERCALSNAPLPFLSRRLGEEGLRWLASHLLAVGVVLGTSVTAPTNFGALWCG